MAGSSRFRVACVFRTGGVYRWEDVEKLMIQLFCNGMINRENKLLCFTDFNAYGGDLTEIVPLEHNWPGWWSKMELFRPNKFGNLLYFDLDTMIVRPMPELNPGAPTALTDFYVPDRIQSSMLYIPMWARELMWRRFIRDPAKYMAQHEVGGDQEFLDYWNWNRFQDIYPDRIVSFKATLKERREVPWPASIVIFHGQPKPRDIQWKLALSGG